MGVLVALAADDWRSRVAVEAASREYLLQLHERLVLDSLDASSMLVVSRERSDGLRNALAALDGAADADLNPTVAVAALHWGVSYRQPRLDGFEDVDHDLVLDPALRSLLVRHRAALRRIADQQHPIYDQTVRDFDRELRAGLSASEYRLYRTMTLRSVRGRSLDRDSAAVVLDAIRRLPKAMNALRNVVDRVYPLEESYAGEEVLPAQREALMRIDSLLGDKAVR